MSRPANIIHCPDCQRMIKHYAKGLCGTCYTYQRTNGRPHVRPLNCRRAHKFCLICLLVFKPIMKKSRYCSHSCDAIWRSLRFYRGITAECQRCHRYRRIRSRKLCASCYVMARTQMQASGVGKCPVPINRFRPIP